MNVGQKIKKARLEKGYTQEELAEMVGVKKSAVAKWENGRVSEIKRSNLNMISKVLNINPNSLLDDIEEKPVETANKLADYFLNMELEEDKNLQKMIERYKKLSPEKQAQVQEYVRFLLGRD